AQNEDILIIAPINLDIEEIQSKYIPTISINIENIYNKILACKRNKNLIPESIFLPLEGIRYPVQLYENGISDIKKRLSAEVQFYYRKKSERLLCLGFSDRVAICGKIINAMNVAYLLQRWAKEKALQRLPVYLSHRAAQMRIQIHDICIHNQRSCWGSCSRYDKTSFNIHLNWRSLLLDIPLLRHLCEHELCHTIFMNHSKEFHNAMQALDRDAEEKERALQNAWTKLPEWTRHYLVPR
nr:M48 family metallopeptidase [Desulfovibrio sp.]